MNTLTLLLEFIYLGEVNVPDTNLNDFLLIGNKFKIRGLIVDIEDEDKTSKLNVNLDSNEITMEHIDDAILDSVKDVDMVTSLNEKANSKKGKPTGNIFTKKRGCLSSLT